MHLIYLDESGNSGHNLNDREQPVFVLCAMVVAEDRWLGLESTLQRILDERLPRWRTMEPFEIHGADLRAGRGPFKEMTPSARIAFRDAWMTAGAEYGARLMHYSVNKRRFAQWLGANLGHGIVVNPYVAAFALLSRCIDNYLRAQPGPPLAILIADENKEVVDDVEKSISALRALEGTLKLSRIVEKGFFIDSRKSLLLQLCDLYTLSLRKRAERMYGLAAKSFDDSGIAAAERLLFTDNQHVQDVLAWLKHREDGAKKVAARGFPEVG